MVKLCEGVTVTGLLGDPSKQVFTGEAVNTCCGDFSISCCGMYAAAAAAAGRVCRLGTFD